MRPRLGRYRWDANGVRFDPIAPVSDVAPEAVPGLEAAVYGLGKTVAKLAKGADNLVPRTREWMGEYERTIEGLVPVRPRGNGS